MRRSALLSLLACLSLAASAASGVDLTLKSYDGPGYTNVTTWDTMIADYKMQTASLFYARGGKETYIDLYNSPQNRDKGRYLLLKFDLSAPRLQYVVGVNSAVLRLYQYATPPFAKNPMYMTQLTQDWTEGTSLGEYNHVCDGAQFYTHNAGTVVQAANFVDNGDSTWYVDGLSALADDPRYTGDKFLRLAGYPENMRNEQDNFTAAASQADLIALGATRGYYFDGATGRLYLNKNDNPIRWYSTADMWTTPGGGEAGAYLASFGNPQPDPDPLLNYIGWFQWDASAVAANWLVNKQLNAGFKIKSDIWQQNPVVAHEYAVDPLLRPELYLDLVIHYPGDADMDLGVGFDDYQKLEVAFGKTTGALWGEGDFDGDGDVDFADYQKLEVNFGTAIPEPATLGLLLLGGLAALRRRQ